MKKVYLIILYTLTFIICAVTITLRFTYFNNTVTNNYTYEFNSININVDVCDIEFKSGDTYNIDITYTTNRVNVILENDILYISSENKFSLINRNNNSKINITIPSDKIIDSINCDTDVSNIFIKDINLSNLIIKSDVSDIDIDNIEVNNIDINTDVSKTIMKLKGSKEDYKFDCKLEVGIVSVNNDNIGSSYNTLSGLNIVKVLTDVGSIKIYFV